MQDRPPLEIRPLVLAARADPPERNDEQLVAVDPSIYESSFGEVLCHSHELFEVNDGSLLHDTRSRDVHAGVSSRVSNGGLEDQKRLFW